MSRQKDNPKQKSNYPDMLTRLEEQRKHGPVQNQKPFKSDLSFKSLNSKMVQMFSGKKGK
jgi:hypothetical protein